MVDMTNRPDVQMRLRTLELGLGHDDFASQCVEGVVETVW
jgi:hypothetical protein